MIWIDIGIKLRSQERIFSGILEIHINTSWDFEIWFHITFTIYFDEKKYQTINHGGRLVQFRYFVFSPRNYENTKIIVFSWSSRKDAILRLFVISSFRPEITKRRRLSLFRGENTINCGVRRRYM